jgi:cytochrome c oxidase cbb3-type subunit 3
MSLRFRNSLVPLLLLAALCSCDREERQGRGKPVSETVPTASPDTVFIATQKLPLLDARALSYERNASAISEGQRLYNWMNCSGCHFHGGGGMGVALMDDKWRYGGRIEEIYATIVQGRPNGMPAFKDKIPEAQVWEIAAFVRSMSGNADKLAAPTRADEMRSTPPISNQNKTPETGDPSAAKAGGG